MLTQYHTIRCKCTMWKLRWYEVWEWNPYTHIYSYISTYPYISISIAIYMYIWINAIFNFHALRCDRAVQAQPIHLSSLETATISLNRAPACCLLSGGESSTGGGRQTPFPSNSLQIVFGILLQWVNAKSLCFRVLWRFFSLVKTPKLDVVTLFASFFGVRGTVPPKMGDWGAPHRDQLMMKCKKCWIFDSDICHVSKTWYLHVH